MLLREVQKPPRPLLFAACIGAFSILAAVVLSSAFLSLVACQRAPVCQLTPRPAIHCPGLSLLVWRSEQCRWGCE